MTKLTNELTSEHRRYLRQCFNPLRKYSASLHQDRVGQACGGKQQSAMLGSTMVGLLSSTACHLHLCYSWHLGATHTSEFWRNTFWGSAVMRTGFLLLAEILCPPWEGQHCKKGFYYHIQGIFSYPFDFPYQQTDLGRLSHWLWTRV